MGGGGADSGQAANRGWLGSASDYLGGILGGADPGTIAGGGIVSGISTLDGLSDVGRRAAEHATQILTDGALGKYPGYGTLWTYDDGVHLETKGWMVLGAGAVALYLVLRG